MDVMVTCMYEKDPISSDCQEQLTLLSVVGLAKFPTPLGALMYVMVTCKYEKRSDEKQLRKNGNTVFPIISLSGFFPTLSS